MIRVDPFKPVYDILNIYPPPDRDFPACLDIEVTNNCNLKCLMCPTGTGIMKRKRGFMADETFNALLNNIKGKKMGLLFKGWGEPLLHPNLLNFIRLAKSDGHLCMLYTNAMLLTDDNIQLLIDMGLDKIKFSVQGINTESYAEMRQGANFTTLVSKIEKMYTLRGSFFLPYMYVGTTTTYESEEAIKTFKEKIGLMCDSVGVGKTKLEHIDINDEQIKKESKTLLKDLKSKHSTIEKRYKLCPEGVWATLAVHWDGKVSACSEDYDDEMLAGNLTDNTLAELFVNGKMREYRRILRNMNSGNFIPPEFVCCAAIIWDCNPKV
jgi:MoaA/NifB/PqqE/SkfB family radical SAM enzyme